MLSIQETNQLVDSIKQANTDFAKTIMSLVEKYQVFTSDDIDVLCSRQESRKRFLSDYPYLKKIDNTVEFSQQLKSPDGRNRYYGEKYVLCNESYVITSQLYGLKKNTMHKDCRTPFYNWVLKKFGVEFNENWWPSLEEYNPGITKEQWLNILEKTTVFGDNALAMFAGMYNLGGTATCAKLSSIYNKPVSHYVMTAVHAAENTLKYTNCPAPPMEKNAKLWPVLFLGKKTREGDEGDFIWKLRDELHQALIDFDIEKYLPTISKVGKFDSWEIIDEITAIKHCDKSFFEYNTSGVPRGICWFFDAEEIDEGKSKQIKIICNGSEYAAKVSNDSTDRRRIRIGWNADLSSVFNTYEKDNAIAIFKKIAVDVFEVIMNEEGETMAGTVLDNIIRALGKIGGKGKYADIYAAYENLTNQELTDGKKAGIRKTIEDHSSDSENFKGQDIFYSVGGKGSGVWGLRIFNSNSVETVRQKIEVVKNYIAAKGFNYEGNLIENFYLSLKSKPFVILAGTSGTGKTRLVKLFAEAIGAEMKLVPVRPDWSDSSDLFGHTDLSNNFHPGAIIEFIKKAEWNKDKPFFLCLDEMNLARVEYYLSDFLSIIETRDRKENGDIETDPLVDVDYYKNKEAQGKFGRVFIPENLYIIGTVNMDETTFPFSKKVLDRANTIEFSYVDLMTKPGEASDSISPLDENNSFLKTEYLYLRDCDDADVVDSVCFDLNELNTILVKANLHVGYRVRDEFCFYMMNNKKADLLERNVAFDNEIMQKILPRIQGSSRAIKDVLSEMFIKCAGDYSGLAGATDFEQMQSYIDSGKGCKYSNSARKIAFMMRRYEEDGFTSYWL